VNLAYALLDSGKQPNSEPKMKATKLLVTVALLALTSTARANLLVNGSFDDLAIAPGSYALFSSIPGWSIDSGPFIEIQNHVAGSPHAGDQYLELDSTANTSVYQDVATGVGTMYNLTFWYSPRPGIAASSNGVQLIVDGVSNTLLIGDGVGNGDNVWTQYSLLVIGDGSTRIEFAGVGTSDSLGGYIDAVSLTSVPEPNVLMLLAAAALAASTFVRRSRMA
jgi:hypothetical protein